MYKPRLIMARGRYMYTVHAMVSNLFYPPRFFFKLALNILWTGFWSMWWNPIWTLWSNFIRKISTALWKWSRLWMVDTGTRGHHRHNQFSQIFLGEKQNMPVRFLKYLTIWGPKYLRNWPDFKFLYFKSHLNQ